MTTTNLNLYIENDYSIYRLIEWLTACVEKRIRKNAAVTVEHLANCSTMKTIIRMGVKMCKEYGEPTADKEERAAVALQQAENIIENARYMAAC